MHFKYLKCWKISNLKVHNLGSVEDTDLDQVGCKKFCRMRNTFFCFMITQFFYFNYGLIYI